MSVYTVHEPPQRSADALVYAERFAFVRDGFYWWAFLLTPLWMLRYRLWLVLVIYLVVVAGLDTVLHGVGASAFVVTVVGFLISLLIGFEAGTLRPLAVSGKERSKRLPNVPTIGETYPGYAVDIWLGLFAPAGTPKPIIDKLRTIVQAELAKPEVAAKINVSGSLMPLILSQDEFAARIKSDDEKFGKLAKELNVHIQ